MDSNVWLTIMSGLGMAGGVWSLVRWGDERIRNGNGHAPVTTPEVVVVPGAMEAEVRETLETLPDKLRDAIVTVSAQNLTEMSVRMERLIQAVQNIPPPKIPPKLEFSLQLVVDRMESLLQMGPPQPPRLDELAKPLAQLPVHLEQKFDKLTADIANLIRPMQQPGRTRYDFRSGHVAPRAPGPINLDLFNTLALQDDELYELIPPEPDIYAANIFNLGPGTLWVRNAATFIDDVQATMLPAQTGDNGVRIPRSLWVVSEDGTTASIRLAY